MWLCEKILLLALIYFFIVFFYVILWFSLFLSLEGLSGGDCRQCLLSSWGVCIFCTFFVISYLLTIYFIANVIIVSLFKTFTYSFYSSHTQYSVFIFFFILLEISYFLKKNLHIANKWDFFVLRNLLFMEF